MDAVGDHDLMHPTCEEVSPQQSADRREETFPMVGMLHPDPDPTVTDLHQNHQTW